MIIPEESEMTLIKFEDLSKDLQKFIISNSKNNTKEIDKINKKIGEIAGYLIAAEKKKLPEYFKAFANLNILNIFNSLLDLDIFNISLCILETLNFLILNLKNNELKLNIYSTKFKTKILGQEMNIIDKLNELNFEDKDEFLSMQINFMKSLSLKLDNSNIYYFFNKDINQFQMLTKSFSMYNNSDPMVRNVVKNILLSIMRIDNEDIKNFIVSFPINIYYTNLVLNFKNYILQLCLIDLSEIYNDSLFGIFRRKHDELIDISMYLGDILELNIKSINFMLINCLLNEIILPLFKVIISRNKETANISIALYIFTVIIHNIRNKDLIDIISYLLFEEKVSQSLLKYVYDYSFKFMSIDYMSKINYIIKNCQLADVNDKQWKDISVYMKFVNGIDLSTGEVHEKNTFDVLKSVIQNKNGQNLIKNEIFELTKAILNSNNEYNILIYNLLIASIINYYNKVDSNPENENEKHIYNPLQLQFFCNDINFISNQDGLFQILLKLIQSENNFRISCYEIILYNIQNLIYKFLPKEGENNNIIDNPDLIQKITNLLISAFNFQIKKIKNIFSNNKNSWKSSFDTMKKAYEHYVRAIDKKINDLITLPSILVPVDYTIYYEDVSKNLLKNLFPYQILTSNFLVLMFLHDTLCKLLNKNNDMIKSKAFPIDLKFKRFSLGKELTKNDIGDNYAFCKVIDEYGFEKNSLVIIIGDMFYLAEINSQNFNDISSVKIIKKIYLRYLEIKVSVKSEEILEIADNDNEKANMKFIVIHCLNADNTGRMFNFLSKQKTNFLEIEYSMILSYLDDLENKFKINDNKENIEEEKNEDNNKDNNNQNNSQSNENIQN